MSTVDGAKEIRVQRGHVEGYGGPGYWWLRVIYKNRELDHAKKVYSELDLGKLEAKLEAKWHKQWDQSELDAIAQKAPQASPTCDHCGNDTLDGGTNCVNMRFCRTCDKAGVIEDYKRQHAERVEVSKRESEAAAKLHADAETAETELALAGAFHWRDGWYFKRAPDGGVRVMRPDTMPMQGYKYLRHDLTIPPNEWASIVCSVSKEGETGERWNAAQDFHGRPEIQP